MSAEPATRSGGSAGQAMVDAGAGAAGSQGGSGGAPDQGRGGAPGSIGGQGGAGAAGGSGGSGGGANEPRADAAMMPGGADGGAPLPSPCEDGRSDLVACFPFDGTAQDESPLGLIAIAPQSAFNEGIERSAIRIAPGRAVRVSAASGLNLRTFTVEAIVRLDRLPTAGGRMGIVDSDTRFGLFVLAGGDLRCAVGGTEVVARAVITAGAWQRVGCRLSPTTLSLTLEGRVVQAVDAPGLQAGADVTSFTIGGNDPSGDELEGLIDTTRIFRSAR